MMNTSFSSGDLVLTGRVLSISTGIVPNGSKACRKSAVLKKGCGIENDAPHSRIREISMISFDSINKFIKTHGLAPKPGDFGENIVISGIGFSCFKLLSKIKICDAVLEIVQLGEPVISSHHQFCGFRLLSNEGVFCRVIKDGEISAGDEVTILETVRK